MRGALRGWAWRTGSCCRLSQGEAPVSGGHKVEIPGTLKVEWVDERGVPFCMSGPIPPRGVTWESAREPAQGRALTSPSMTARRSFVHGTDVS